MIVKQEYKFKRFIAIAVMLMVTCSFGNATNYSGKNPGSANVINTGNQYTFSNNVLSFTFQLNFNNLSIVTISDLENKSKDYLQVGELFKLVLNDGSTIIDSKMSAGTVSIEKLIGNSQSLRVRERFNGWKLVIPFIYSSGDKELSLTWSAILRDESNYINQEISFTATSGDWDIDRIYMIDITGDDVKKIDKDAGSPFLAGQFFFGQETPVAECSVNNNQATAYFPRQYLTHEGESFKQTSAIGVFPDNQARRGFQYYLERERIREHYAFLHYNTWWDINDSAVNETNVIDRINAFGQELVVERGVNLKGFIVDDGYDELHNANTIWELKKSQFPNGISPLKEAAAKYGANMGFWMSPAGGYSGVAERVAIARKVNSNTETHTDGTFKISGSNYYSIFKTAVFKKMDSDVQSFKFDRISGSEDVYAVAQLSQEMRNKNNQVFINATVGTWGSPYFLWFFDSFWRQGYDARGAVDVTRDQQVTYRDSESYKLTYHNPLVPLNSLMVHGIGQGESYQGKSYSHDADGNPLDMTKSANLQDFRDEVRNYFAQGLNLQELYITPSLMTEECWDVLAEAAKWGHVNHDVLLDAHFIGGNPGHNELYGVASWSKDKAILMLRNPSAKQDAISLDPLTAFNIPKSDFTDYILVDPFDSNAQKLSFEIGVKRTFTIPASSILLFEAIPVKNTNSK